MRGYFAIGAEGISKPVNLGTLVRTAHAFGASFVFLVDAYYKVREAMSDTSRAESQLPIYDFASVAEMRLPRGCKLVGVELVDEATPLPSFRHPLNAGYVFGPERGNLSSGLLGRCDWVVKIPMRFCANLGVAGAIVMYDRMLCHGRFDPRPVRTGAPTETRASHVHGAPLLRHPSESEWERLTPGCPTRSAK
jgi:tRNA G18 (ribose-2'-O)-methylase SpoU